jgi:N-acetylmuramoyl-L-alanine amidase
MRQINKIVIHCAATPNFQHFTTADIDKWHKQRGFFRQNPVGNPALKSIGYHFVIYLDGSVHPGRDISEIGAHAAGANANSIGICMIGTDDFTVGQWDALKTLVRKLRKEHGPASVIGHRDIPGVKKTCPGFDVAKWFKAVQNEEVKL